MNKILCFLLFLFGIVSDARSYTYINSLGAGFADPTVHIRLTSLSETCANAGLSGDKILQLINPAINSYWNRVPTSRLRLRNAGYLQTTNDDFLFGRLCSAQLDNDCNPPIVPMVNEIVITCNQNSSNFPSDRVYAVTLNNNLTTRHIAGSVILLNDTSTTMLANLNDDELIAVLAHEIGHAIGLGHTQNPNNLMFYSLRSNSRRVALGQDDVNGVSSLYPHSMDACGAFSTHDSNRLWYQSFSVSVMIGLIVGFLCVGLFLSIRRLFSF